MASFSLWRAYVCSLSSVLPPIWLYLSSELPSHAVVFCLQEGKLPFDLALSNGCSMSLRALLQPGTAAWCDGGEGFQQPDRPLVSAAESRVFESLAHLIDPNPRRLKRIVSVYALVNEVAKRMPLSEGGSKDSCANLTYQ